MDNLKSIIKKRFKKSVLSQQIAASLIVEYADQKIREFWGNKGAEQAKAVSLRSFILKINCSNSIIAQELGFKKNTLIRLINEKFPNAVKRVNIVQKGIVKYDE
ncbi:MAG: DciA family protein [Patescibacteria group bacterium]